MELNSIKYTNFLNIKEFKYSKDNIIKKSKIKRKVKENNRMNKIIIIYNIKNNSYKINIMNFIFFNINCIALYIFNFLIILNLFNKTINNKFIYYL